MKYLSRTVSLGVLVALLVSPIAARAEIAPLPRPHAPAPVVKPTTPSVQKAPVQKVPVQPVPVQQAPVQQTPVQQTPSAPVIVKTPAPAVSAGGRVLAPVSLAVETGGHADPPPVVVPVAVATAATSSPPTVKLVPTKLIEVGHDPIPSHDAWPSWVLTVLTVLISAEAFLVVRLSRTRSRGPQSISI